MTKHFINVLPQLLNLYKTNPEKIVNLMTILQYFDLSLLTQNGDNLETLLCLINEIMGIHTDEEVLRTCAESYKYLYDEAYRFSRNVWLNKSQLIDTLIIKIDSWNVWKDLYNKWIHPLTQEAVELPVEATKYAMITGHFGLNWRLSLIHTNKSVIIKSVLRRSLGAYISELRTITTCTRTDELRQEAYSIMCDRVINFSIEFDGEAHNSNRRPETLHKKRNFLAVCAIQNYVKLVLQRGSN